VPGRAPERSDESERMIRELRCSPHRPQRARLGQAPPVHSQKFSPKCLFRHILDITPLPAIFYGRFFRAILCFQYFARFWGEGAYLWVSSGQRLGGRSPRSGDEHGSLSALRIQVQPAHLLEFSPKSLFFHILRISRLTTIFCEHLFLATLCFQYFARFLGEGEYQRLSPLVLVFWSLTTSRCPLQKRRHAG